MDTFYTDKLLTLEHAKKYCTYMYERVTDYQDLHVGNTQSLLPYKRQM